MSAAVNILCYGDSNTFGYNPINHGRFPRDVRWTGRLQKMLGPNFNVIEDGLNRRTTMWNDPQRDFRNARKTFPLAIETSRPLDLVIISLGANDTKTYYNQTAANIAAGIESLIRIIKEWPWGGFYTEPRVLVVSPPLVTEAAYIGNPLSAFDALSVERSRKLAGLFEMVCGIYGVDFLDGSLVTPVGPDGLHLDEAGHRKMAEAIHGYVVGLWPNGMED